MEKIEVSALEKNQVKVPKRIAGGSTKMRMITETWGNSFTGKPEGLIRLEGILEDWNDWKGSWRLHYKVVKKLDHTLKLDSYDQGRKNNC